MAIKAKQLSVTLPFGIGGITFIADESQQRAAWALYVELVTRIAVQQLKEGDPGNTLDDEGLLREALASLHKVFQITRSIIKEAGPEIADGPESLGPIAIEILNKGLRPFLSKWHPRLQDHEARKPANIGAFEHEQQWKYYRDMRKELRALQANLSIYADMLGEISGAKHYSTSAE